MQVYKKNKEVKSGHPLATSLRDDEQRELHETSTYIDIIKQRQNQMLCFNSVSWSRQVQ